MSGTINIHQDHHICGLFNDAISQNDIYRFALSIGAQVSNSLSRQIIIATDNSHLSRKLADLAIGGLTGADCQVTNLGVAPYSMLTYATRSLNIPNALMLTPGEGGEDSVGFRVILDNKPVPSFALKNMLEESRDSKFKTINGTGRCTNVDLYQGYLRWLMHGTRPRKGELSVLWDVQNGATSEIITSIASMLPGRHVVINQEDPTADGNTLALNSANLGDLVISGGYDLGISLNGDGTTLHMCDELGNPVHEWHRLSILSTRSKRQPVAGNGLLASRRKARSDILKHTLKIIRVLTESGAPVSSHIDRTDTGSISLGKGSVPPSALSLQANRA